MTQQSDNPFAEMEAKIALERAAAQARALVEKARVRMITGKVRGVGAAACVFFSTLLMKLKLVVDDQEQTTKTLCTDGASLWYSPKFVAGIKDLEQACGVLAHEVMHCALLHQARREHREDRRWQVACDLVVNELLRQANFQLPQGALFAAEGEYQYLPRGKSEEEYYELIRKQEEQGDGQEQGGDGGGQGAAFSAAGQGGPVPGQDPPVAGDGAPGKQPTPDPGGCGSVKQPAGNGSGQARSQAEWRANVAQAGNAAAKEAGRGKGDTPAWMKRLVGDVSKPKVPWQDVLREFVTRFAANDYSWDRPNSRIMAAAGVYLPRLHSLDLGQVLVFVDTSGSIGQATLDLFAAELQGILDDFPQVELKIAYHDARVYEDDLQEWSPSDGPLQMKPVGGGGTDHRPCFEWLEGGAAERGIEPACVVCLTDMMSCFPDTGPDVPVMWCQVGSWECQPPPFGQHLKIPEGP